MALFGTLWFLFGMFVVHLTMSFLFISGFFLSKTELLINSECDTYPLQMKQDNNNNNSNPPYDINYNQIFKSLDTDNNANELGHKTKCWTQQKYDKIIILIIDALKFDFVSPLVDKNAKVTYYSHHLSSINNLLLKNTSYRHSKLFKFISDPPTVTAQRIKGFTTGTLPTFFDVRNSFTSSQIVIDNILYQLKINGNYNITFMGDDTWNNLFNFNLYFQTENYPYPSFDVYDLYTVDNGCKKHLYESLYDDNKLTKWNVLISHFLGVDHVGHTYHMNHPKMEEKLNEMNEIINNVTLWIKQYKDKNKNKDILLLIFGDHGMTSTGDHGGATTDETNAALFMYSTKYLYPYYPFTIDNDSNNNHNMYREITQINIVPTICLLMGVPIPFENIGAIIPEFYLEILQRHKKVDMNVLLNSWKDLLKAMSLNAFQVYQYLYTYNHNANSDTFSDKELMDLYQQLMDGIRDLNQLQLENKDIEINNIQAIVKKFQTFLTDAYSLCLRKWTKFNLHMMSVAVIVGLFGAIGLISMSIDMNSSDSVKECDITLIIWSKINARFDITIFVLSFYYIKYFFYNDYALSDVFISLQILFQSIGCNFVFTLCVQYMSCNVDWINTLNRFDSIVLCVLVFMYFQGLFTDTYIKYEPQLLLFLIIITFVMIVISSFRQHAESNILLIKRVRHSMVYIIPAILCIRWMGISELNDMEPDYAWLASKSIDRKYWMIEMWSYFTVIIPTFIVPLVLFYLYYTLKLMNVLNLIQCILSFISELLLLIYWIITGDGEYFRAQYNNNIYTYLWLFPTFIWLLFVIQCILWYLQIKKISSKAFNYKIKAVIGYIMILLIELLIIINPSLCLVLGANSHFIIIYILIFLYFLTKSSMIINQHLIVINNYEIWIGWLLYQYLFFVSGHRCMFSKVSVKAAYVGGFNYNFTRALILTILHHISGHLFSFLIIPILILNRLYFYYNEMDLKYIIDSIKYNVCKYVYISITFSTIFVLCSMCNCYMHRRHLLVWDIFAPKIIFDIVHILIIDILSAACVMLTCFILINLTKKSSLLIKLV